MERQSPNGLIIPDIKNDSLEILSDNMRSREFRISFVAEELATIGNEPVFSDYLHQSADELFKKGKRINEYVQAVAMMHYVLRNSLNGYPPISKETVSSLKEKECYPILYRRSYPNLMAWVEDESRRDITNASQIRKGLMNTFALAYKELSPPPQPRFSFFRRNGKV